VTATGDARFVFNIVWTGAVFSPLHYFVCSLMAHSGARFRFVGNGCTPDSLADMEVFASRHADRVVDIVDACPERMGAHGVALDEVMKIRDDGEFFCLVDPDIMARGTFMAEFVDEMSRHDAVTSGRGVWCESDVVPPGHPGVAGEHFFREDGFVFGSPHFAIYRRAALDETIERWGVTFRTAGPDIPDETRRRLVEGGHRYRIYDTGKVLNIMFQEDHSLVHYEHPRLMHIGGMSHYLEPGKYIVVDGREEPDWIRYRNVSDRFEVAQFTAAMLHALIDQRELPPIPPDLEPSLVTRLETVRSEMVDLVETYRGC
jgi:hypothetical protein